MTRYTPQWLQSGSYAASQDRRLIGALWPAAASTGGAVTAGAAMTVNVAPGQVAVPTQNNTGTSLCSSDAVEAVTLTAAPGSGTNRYDLIICRPRGNDLDGGANNDFIFDFVTGTAAASPTVPATPAGTVALAQIYVPGGSASVSAGNITDVRPGGLATGGSGAGSGPRGWIASIVGPATAVNCGSSPTTILTLAVSGLVAGRRYKVTAWVSGSQQTSTGTGYAGINDSAGYITGTQRIVSFTAAPAAAIFPGTFVITFTAAAATDTFTMVGTTSAGAFQVNTNAALILVEDIGST